ncbi:GntR family transcriptional regulator [Blastococcus sp. SYSU DS0533]
MDPGADATLVPPDGSANEDAGPVFRQVAAEIETAIVDGSLAEEAQAPSSNELPAFHRINPATAAEGQIELVADGTLYETRGVGVFVATGAREQLLERRRSEFADQYVHPLMTEARKRASAVASSPSASPSWSPTSSR